MRRSFLRSPSSESFLRMTSPLLLGTITHLESIGVDMSNLIFIGLGLHDEKGITLAGLEAIKGCDKLFMEEYTAFLTGTSHERLEALYGMPIELLDRKAVEDGHSILESARTRNTAFLVPGDVMSATTHIDLTLRARDMGIETSIVPGVSALNAVPGFLGLQIYKFGKITTIPFWEDDYKPASFYDAIADNLEMGLHSLVLLDIQAHVPRYMTASHALEMLIEVEKDCQKGIFTPHRLVCVVARAGGPDVLVRAGTLAELRGMDFGGPMHSIVVPGKMHFMEAEALVKLAGAPKEIMD